MNSKKVKVGYLLSHPIPYQSALLRTISQESEIELKVYYCSDFTIHQIKEKTFNVPIKWNVELLEGYNYEFLPAIPPRCRTTFFKPINYGLMNRLLKDNISVLWIHGYWRFFNLISIVRAKKQGLKIFLRDEATLISAKRSWIKKKIKRYFFKWLDKKVDVFLSIGSLNREYYISYGISPYKIVCVPYTVDNKFFQILASQNKKKIPELKKKLNLAPNKPIILFVGRMIERKRAMDLLEAYIKLNRGLKEPFCYLLFIGDGPQRKLLEYRASNSKLNTIKFLGFINQTQLPLYYSLCDVFVLPSIYEPWGLVINEVMNTGKPVIVSDQVGCAADLVKPGVNGYIFPAGDVDSLARSLKEILSSCKIQKMGEESLKIINNWGFKQDIEGLKEALIKCGVWHSS